MKKPNLIIENLKAILEECTASEDAVSYVNGEDAGTLKAAIEALEKQEQVNTQSVNLTHTTYPNALESLKILESAKDENGCVPMSLVRLAFRNVFEQIRGMKDDKP